MRYWIIFVVVLWIIAASCKVDTVTKTSCTEEGVTMCGGINLQTCTGGSWEITETCSTSGRECVERNGSAQCEMLADAGEDLTEEPEVAEIVCNEGICDCPTDMFVVGEFCIGHLDSVANIDDLEGFRTGYQNISMARNNEASYLGTTILANFDGSINVISFDFTPADGSFEVQESAIFVWDISRSLSVVTMETYIIGTQIYSIFSDYLHGTYMISLDDESMDMAHFLEIPTGCAGDQLVDNRCVYDVKELNLNVPNEGDFVAHALQYDGLVITTRESNECQRASEDWEGCVAWIKPTDFIHGHVLPVSQFFKISQDDSNSMFVLNHFSMVTAIEMNFETWGVDVIYQFSNNEDGFIVTRMEKDPEQDLFYLLGSQCLDGNTSDCEATGTVLQILEFTSNGFEEKGKIMLDGYYPLSQPMMNKIVGSESVSRFLSFAARRIGSSEQAVDGGIWVVDISDILNPKTTRLPSYKLPEHTSSLPGTTFVTAAIEDMLFVPWDIAILALQIKIDTE